MKIIIVLLCCVLLFCSCSNEKNDEITPEQQAREIQNSIMICFEKRDSDNLKALFSKKIQNRSTLDSEIETAFDFIDGKIVSYDEPIPGAAGPIGDKYFGATTEKIKTDKDIEYKIDFGGYESNDKESDNIGVEGIRIVNITENANLSPNASNKERDACCRYIGDYTN
ncbi:MAG: DUF5104 domain-containing protein [Ruminococcus sp.]|nr:DUF5104 domain-containing protein [Ruminococcus sp.]